MTDRLPYVSSYTDRHGRLRWRYRRNGVTVALPGQPGDEAFQAAYFAALEGRATRAEVIRHPNHAKPRTLQSAWRNYALHDPEFKRLRPNSRNQYIARAERLLELRVSDHDDLKWGDVPVADIRRRHVKSLLAQMTDRPHAASDALVVLRKMLLVALDQEWITHDPTHRLRHAPEIKGHRAWTDEERAQFEAYWPLGSRARTVYALALYTGQRRGDLVRITWKDVAGDTLTLTQQKTGKRLVLPILPVLREALDAAPRSGPTVLHTESGFHRSAEGLTNDMRRWSASAGLKGTTVHGLRKTLGKLLAEQGATTRELMDALGHDAIEHAALYSREAEQERMAREAFRKVAGRLRPRLVVAGGEPIGEPVGEPRRKRLK